MPIIYLKHPIHGTKIANMDLEAEQDEENGWIRYNPDIPSFLNAHDSENVLEVKRRGRRKATEGV